MMIGRDVRARMPVLLIGGTGGGKSHMIRDVARMLSIGYKETNAYPNMDISLWFGMHRPVERDGFIGLDWQNGLLTEAALNGEAFFMEEATRAPQDATGRLFGPTDNGFRYLALPEKGSLSEPIHKDFWLIATANPATAGYAVQRMDKAFNSRFLIIEIKEPVADEVRILDDLIGQHQHREKFWRVILDCRNHPESYINTRDIIMAARCLGLGFEPMRAIEIAIAHKYDDFTDPIMKCADLHFNGKAPVQEEANG
jgi:MoxR-like ATPase